MNKPDHIKLPVLIAAHTGARLSEFIDAHTKDIELVEGVWCLQIREDNREEGQTIKTEGSKRTVPLHSAILPMVLAYRDFARRRAAFPAVQVRS